MDVRTDARTDARGPTLIRNLYTIFSNELEFRESDVSPGKQKSNKSNSSNVYPPAKIFLEKRINNTI